MILSLSKIPSKLITKNIPKIFGLRKFHKKSQVEKQIRRIKRYGLFGISGILITSYILIRRNNEEYMNVNLQESVGKNRIDDLTRTSNNLNVEEGKPDETIREKYNFINKVVNQCAPAVFYLEMRDPYKKDLETGEPMITSNGSGFLISEDGWALTNAHVVLDKSQSTITAIMRDGRRFKVKVEDADMNVDLALLKLDAIEKLPSLQFGRPGDTGVGEWVVALGSPLSLSNSVTVGIISCVDRQAEDLGLKNYSMTYIQTDASITFGNSGGPLVNLDGNVIGINNLRLTSGISFAIPVEYAQKFLENSKHRIKNDLFTGPMGKILFGMTTISITPAVLSDLLRENRNIPDDVNKGLLIWKVIPETPASRCGMEVGDIITHINGVPVEEAADLYLLSKSDEITQFRLIHNGKRKTVILDPNIFK